MEALLLVLFYALSWFLKNKQQKSVHKQIESDPDWDPIDEKENSLNEPSWIEQFIDKTNDSLKETLLADFETPTKSSEYQNDIVEEEPRNSSSVEIEQKPETKIVQKKTLPSQLAYKRKNTRNVLRS